MDDNPTGAERPRTGFPPPELADADGLLAVGGDPGMPRTVGNPTKQNPLDPCMLKRIETWLTIISAIFCASETS